MESDMIFGLAVLALSACIIPGIIWSIKSTSRHDREIGVIHVLLQTHADDMKEVKQTINKIYELLMGKKVNEND